MATGLPKVNLHLETAQSALAVLRTLLAEAMHEDDRKTLDDLINRASEAMDSASTVLTNIRARLDDISDQL